MRLQNLRFKVPDRNLRVKVKGEGLRVWGKVLGVNPGRSEKVPAGHARHGWMPCVQCLRFSAWDMGFGVQGCGFQGMGFRI